LSAAYEARPNGCKHIYGLSLLFRKLNFLMRKLLGCNFFNNPPGLETKQPAASEESYCIIARRKIDREANSFPYYEGVSMLDFHFGGLGIWIRRSWLSNCNCFVRMSVAVNGIIFGSVVSDRSQSPIYYFILHPQNVSFCRWSRAWFRIGKTKG